MNYVITQYVHIGILRTLVTRKYIDELTYRILGCAIEVHKLLGPGLLESVYEKCFVRELSLRGFSFRLQESVDLNYKGVELEASLRYDVLIEELIVVELKSIEEIMPIHISVLLTYMQMLQKPKGILINFNTTNIIKHGQKTLVNSIYASLPRN